MGKVLTLLNEALLVNVLFNSRAFKCHLRVTVWEAAAARASVPGSSCHHVTFLLVTVSVPAVPSCRKMHQMNNWWGTKYCLNGQNPWMAEPWAGLLSVCDSLGSRLRLFFPSHPISALDISLLFHQMKERFVNPESPWFHFRLRREMRFRLQAIFGPSLSKPMQRRFCCSWSPQAHHWTPLAHTAALGSWIQLCSSKAGDEINSGNSGSVFL